MKKKSQIKLNEKNYLKRGLNTFRKKTTAVTVIQTTVIEQLGLKLGGFLSFFVCFFCCKCNYFHYLNEVFFPCLICFEKSLR